MSAASGAESHDSQGEVNPALPENVIPLRSGLVQPAPVEPRHLQAADKAPVQKPTPLFGTAAWNLREWPLFLVMFSIAGSLVLVLIDSFRTGSIAFGISLALGFFLRAVLNDHEAGLLKVRSRRVDLLVLGALSVAMLLTAMWVPVNV